MPREREIRFYMATFDLGYEAAREKIVREHSDGIRAGVAYKRQIQDDGRAMEFLKAYPKFLTPATQHQLPGYLHRFKDYQPTHDQGVMALAKAYDWALRTARGEVVGLVLYSVKDVRSGPGGQKVFGFGCGKSHLARAAEEMLRACGQYSGQFLGADQMVDVIRSTYDKDSSTTEADLYRQWRKGWFILDDLGKEYVREDSREWWRNVLFKLVNGIHETHSLMITTNLKPQDIAAMVDSATASRLYGMCGDGGFVNMGDIPDYRYVLGRQRDEQPLED